MMKYFKNFSVTILAFCFLLTFGCGEDNEDAIDFGKFEGSTYSNAYFDLNVSIPETWNVMDDETRIAVMQQGAKLAAGDNKNLSAVLNAADLQNLSLLSASESPLGAPVSTNPLFMIIAEKITHLPGVKRGSDYHFHSKKLMDESALNVSFPKNVYEENIDGVSFDVLELMINMGSVTNYQKQYATIIKKYALLIIVTYQDNTGLGKLQNILHNVSLSGV